MVTGGLLHGSQVSLSTHLGIDASHSEEPSRLHNGPRRAGSCQVSSGDMAFSGVIKSMGHSYGFIKCDETHATYQRDVFINLSVIGDDAYKALTCGSTVSFDVAVDEKGQPAKLHLDFDDNSFTVAETGQVASRLHRAARPSLSLPALHTLPSSHPAFTPCNPAFPVMQLWAAIPSTTSTKFEVHV